MEPCNQPADGLLVCDTYDSLHCHDAALVDCYEVLFATSSTKKARGDQKRPSSMMKEKLAKTLDWLSNVTLRSIVRSDDNVPSGAVTADTL